MRETVEMNEFMHEINMLYLHPNRLPLPECYRIAKRIFKQNGFVNVPSLSAVRREIQRLPKNVVTRARGIA